MLSAFSAWRRAARVMLVAMALPVSFIIPAMAQQAPPEYRTQALSVFGSFLCDNIAFRPGSATGFSAGLDFTHFFHRFPVAASFEGRVGSAFGNVANERSYTLGPRMEYGAGRIRPYGEFEVGLGTIHFGPALSYLQGYAGDRSTIVAGGGGVDIGILRNLAAQVDFQAQHWDTEPRTHQVFIPTQVTVGLHYTLPFRSFIRSGDPQYR